MQSHGCAHRHIGIPMQNMSHIKYNPPDMAYAEYTCRRLHTHKNINRITFPYSNWKCNVAAENRDYIFVFDQTSCSYILSTLYRRFLLCQMSASLAHFLVQFANIARICELRKFLSCQFEYIITGNMMRANALCKCKIF